jgi:hypothetical protein
VRRLYTVAEAERALPYVRRIVEEVQERYRLIRDRGRDHKRLPPAEEGPRAALRAEIKEQALGIEACMGELRGIGAELKDYETGLVDFPAELEGRPILLCWKHGEGRIAFWHEVHDGFRGRRPVPPGEPGWPRGARASPCLPRQPDE